MVNLMRQKSLERIEEHLDMIWSIALGLGSLKLLDKIEALQRKTLRMKRKC